MLLSNGLRCRAISSSLMRLLMRIPAMLLGSDKTIGSFMLHSAKSELMPVAYPLMVFDLRESLFLKFTPDMRYPIYIVTMRWYPL